VKKAGIDYYVAVAADANASAQLAALGEPCVDRADEEVAKLGLQWGHEGWRRMTWSKVFVLDAVVDYGFNLVVSDIDVVWFKDPLPLFARHPDADLLFSEDGGASRNAPGDDGLEEGGNPHHNFNTGGPPPGGAGEQLGDKGPGRAAALAALRLSAERLWRPAGALRRGPPAGPGRAARAAAARPVAPQECT
jgi:hypothetical protein